MRPIVPAEGCCYNYAQGGLVIYGDDDNFIKLVAFAILWDPPDRVRQGDTEGTTGYPRYGNSNVGPPGVTTWLRIVKTTSGRNELYRAYTSDDGTTWEPGGVWTHQLGADAKIGLVSMAARLALLLRLRPRLPARHLARRSDTPASGDRRRGILIGERMVRNVEQRALDAYLARFGGQPEVLASAPGRVNLIGSTPTITAGLCFPVPSNNG